MKITVLSENSSCRHGIVAEHGLSLFIEAKGKKILFDTGASGVFADNAAAMGIDLSLADIAVISHGHYDHGGGIRRFLEINKNAPVYISSKGFGEYYNGKGEYIGLDKSLAACGRLTYVYDHLELWDGMELFSKNGEKPVADIRPFGQRELCGGGFVSERYLHEQYLLITEGSKRVLFSGCSHKGIENITEWFKPDVLVGGFHFSKMQVGEELFSLAKNLASYNTRYYTCHCTGSEQLAAMGEYIKELHGISAGSVVEL